MDLGLLEAAPNARWGKGACSSDDARVRALLTRRRWCLRRSADDRVEETRESAVQILAAQDVHARGAGVELVNDTCLAECGEMVRRRGSGLGGLNGKRLTPL